MSGKKGAINSEPAGKPNRVPFRQVPANGWKMRRMPKDLKAQLDALIADGRFHSSQELAKWLADNGFEISARTINRYGQSFERRLDAVRMATEQARIVCEQFKDDDAQMQTALLRLVQTQLFQVLAVANGRGSWKRRGATIAPVNIGALARCVSGLAKTETEHRKWAERMRAGVAAVEKKVEEARTKGLSKDAADQIRAVLLGV
jgi:hypothetical protein